MIVQIGTEVLRKKAIPVPKKDIGGVRLTALVKKMSKALAKEDNGVAIAAPQVGVSERLFVVAGKVFLPEDSPKEAPVPPDKVFINPEIVRLSRTKRVMSEGCLSVRGTYGTVLRHEKASIKAQDEKGKTITYNASGLLAHIFQHEVDHLEGVLYVDKALQVEDESEREALRAKHPA